MRFVLTALVRLIGYLAVALSVVAIGIGRSVPHVPELHTAAVPRYYAIGGASFSPPRTSMVILDADRGVLHPAPLPNDQTFDMGSCSPWVGSDGSFAMIGRMLDGGGGRLDVLRLDADAGLRRGLTATTSTSVQIEPVLSGRPCWLPRWAGHLVIPAGDGKLYAVALGPEATGEADRSSVAADAEALARPLRWACTPPGDALPILTDPIAPDVAALGGRLIVSLSRAHDQGGRSVYGPSELWWLDVDPVRCLILDAGRFEREYDPEKASSVVGDERLANVAVARDGSVVMAYLSRRRKEAQWRLMVAPLRVDRTPRRDELTIGPAAEVGADVVVTTPALSPDGRWVYPIARLTNGSTPCVERRSVADALGRTGIAAAGAWRPPAS